MVVADSSPVVQMSKHHSYSTMEAKAYHSIRGRVERKIWWARKARESEARPYDYDPDYIGIHRRDSKHYWEDVEDATLRFKMKFRVKFKVENNRTYKLHRSIFDDTSPYTGRHRGEVQVQEEALPASS